MSYTVLDTPCREYQGYVDENGYARRRFRGAMWYVHRYVWMLANGPIPKGTFVLHRCDNPPCFRLDHLFLGTAKDNSADMVTKGRATQHGVVRLPEEEIIRLRSEGWSLRRIAAAVGCSAAGALYVLRRHEDAAIH